MALNSLQEREITVAQVSTRFGRHASWLDAAAEVAVLPYAAVRQRIAVALEQAAWAGGEDLHRSARLRRADRRAGPKGVLTMLADLLRRNAAWSARRTREEPDYLARLVTRQSPEFCWIGCSDSRVPVNVVAGLDSVEVFVHRIVANVIHASDMRGLELAVEALKIREIVVCGHYGRGGVKAATEDLAHGLEDHWLEPLRRLALQYALDLAREADAGERRPRSSSAPGRGGSRFRCMV